MRKGKKMNHRTLLAAAATLATACLLAGCSTTALASTGDKAKWCGTFTSADGDGTQITTMANGHSRWLIDGREYYMDWEKTGRTLKFKMAFFSATLELDNTTKTNGETLYPMYEADGDLFYYTYQPGKCN